MVLVNLFVTRKKSKQACWWDTSIFFNQDKKGIFFFLKNYSVFVYLLSFINWPRFKITFNIFMNFFEILTYYFFISIASLISKYKSWIYKIISIKLHNIIFKYLAIEIKENWRDIYHKSHFKSLWLPILDFILTKGTLYSYNQIIIKYSLYR